MPMPGSVVNEDSGYRGVGYAGIDIDEGDGGICPVPTGYVPPKVAKIYPASRQRSNKGWGLKDSWLLIVCHD